MGSITDGLDFILLTLPCMSFRLPTSLTCCKVMNFFFHKQNFIEKKTKKLKKNYLLKTIKMNTNIALIFFAVQNFIYLCIVK